MGLTPEEKRAKEIARHAAYRAANSDKINARRRLAYSAAARARRAARYDANREKIAAVAAAYHAANRDKINACKAAAAAANRQHAQATHFFSTIHALNQLSQKTA